MPNEETDFEENIEKPLHDLWKYIRFWPDMAWTGFCWLNTEAQNEAKSELSKVRNNFEEFLVLCEPEEVQMIIALFEQSGWHYIYTHPKTCHAMIAGPASKTYSIGKVQIGVNHSAFYSSKNTMIEALNEIIQKLEYFDKPPPPADITPECFQQDKAIDLDME